MALTNTDLRAVLAERAAGTPADSAVARVAAVDKRVRGIRRRRATGASLAVVVVLLVVTGLGGLLRDGRERTAPVPAHLQKVAGGMLPRYTGGGEATAYTSFQTDEKRETTFTFTPTSWGFLVSITCDKDMPESRMVSMEVNGKSLLAGSCNTGLNTAGPAYGGEQARAEDLGLRLGVPATVHLRIIDGRALAARDAARDHITGARGSPSTPEEQPIYLGALADYRVAVAMYSPMPIADYPFPPRPHKLASLDEGGATFGSGRVLGTVDSRAVGPNGRGAVTATLTNNGFHTEIYAVAPGAVTVSVDGRTIDLAANWTWVGSGFGGLTLTAAELRKLGIDVKTGDRVSMEFAGARFAVPGWRAEVRQGS